MTVNEVIRAMKTKNGLGTKMSEKQLTAISGAVGDLIQAIMGIEDVRGHAVIEVYGHGDILGVKPIGDYPAYILVNADGTPFEYSGVMSEPIFDKSISDSLAPLLYKSVEKLCKLPFEVECIYFSVSSAIWDEG